MEIRPVYDITMEKILGTVGERINVTDGKTNYFLFDVARKTLTDY